MIDPEGSGLVFILSAPRAGSTLLAALLGGHSHVLSPPEPWLLLSLDSIYSDAVLSVAPYDGELARTAIRELLDYGTFLAAARAFSLAAYNSLLSRTRKSIFVDKSPRYHHVLGLLDDLFPKAKKVFLNRNPLDIVASCKGTWSKSIEEMIGVNVTPSSFDNTIGLKALAEYFRVSVSDKFSLRYEDLVEDPSRHLRALCDWLSLEFEPPMLDYGSNETLMQAYSVAPMGDKTILQNGRAHASSVGRWKQMLSPDEIHKVLGALGSRLFVTLGYKYVLDEASGVAGIAPDTIEENGHLDSVADSRTRYLEALRLVAANHPSGIPSMASLLSSADAGLSSTLRRIEVLEDHLKSSEADRAARLEAIAGLREKMESFEADREERLRLIQKLNGELETSLKDRVEHLEIERKLKKRIDECEVELARLNASFPVRAMRKLGWR